MENPSYSDSPKDHRMISSKNGWCGATARNHPKNITIYKKMVGNKIISNIYIYIWQVYWWLISTLQRNLTLPVPYVFGCEKSSLQFLVVDPSPPKIPTGLGKSLRFRWLGHGWKIANNVTRPGYLLQFAMDFDGPNRNRWWLPNLIAWWIFPWQTVNVITRWLFS